MSITLNFTSLFFIGLGVMFGNHIIPLGGLFFVCSLVAWVLLEEEMGLIQKFIGLFMIIVNAVIVGVAIF